MDTKSPIYNELNKSWKSTCRILFGDEIGELNEYEDWLREFMPQSRGRKSHVSGKEIVLPLDEYCDGARFVSADEISETKTALNINEIKDIDSILKAVSQQWVYAGNRSFGKSGHVESSDAVIDSQYVSGSVKIEGSRDVFASSQIYGAASRSSAAPAFSGSDSR